MSVWFLFGLLEPPSRKHLSTNTEYETSDDLHADFRPSAVLSLVTSGYWA